MDVAAAREFLEGNHRAVMATKKANGDPQLSPVTVVMNDDGRAMISTRETAMKVKNLERDPKAWLAVFTDRFFGDWVQIEGAVEIVRLPDAMELLVDYYRRVSGEHPDWDDYRKAMQDQRRVMLLVSLDKVGPTVSG